MYTRVDVEAMTNRLQCCVRFNQPEISNSKLRNTRNHWLSRQYVFSYVNFI